MVGMMKRIFLIVLDSFGIGAAPDAADFGDENTNTLGSVVKSEKFSCPNLQDLGLFNIDGVTCGTPADRPKGNYGRLREKAGARIPLSDTGNSRGSSAIRQCPYSRMGFQRDS